MRAPVDPSRHFLRQQLPVKCSARPVSVPWNCWHGVVIPLHRAITAGTLPGAWRPRRLVQPALGAETGTAGRLPQASAVPADSALPVW